jgi:hypothetical protein
VFITTASIQITAFNPEVVIRLSPDRHFIEATALARAQVRAMANAPPISRRRTAPAPFAGHDRVLMKFQVTHR